jgi:hypothetical protein
MAQLEQAQSLTGRIAAAGVVLFAFNLIPAFPMDETPCCGRSQRYGWLLRAPRGSASISRGWRWSSGSRPLGNPPLLVLVAVFIAAAAGGDDCNTGCASTRRCLASHAAITSTGSLNPLSTADDAAALLRAHCNRSSRRRWREACAALTHTA